MEGGLGLCTILILIPRLFALQELNAPSRRRGKRLPDAFTTPPLSPPLGIDRAMIGSGSAKKAQLDRKSAATPTPSSVALLGMGKESGRGSVRNSGAA